jgi:peroxiredoxin/uncharacterized membrane protein YphA (DoxX/SURF4 family)
MDAALVIARLLLACVFALAGIAKLLDRDGSRKAAAGFGVPDRLAGVVGILLPLAELATAVALLPAATAALALLLLFVVAIAANLARGRQPDCHCFGQIHSEPAGPATLIRNGVLAAVAGLVVAQGPSGGGPEVLAWVGGAADAGWAGPVALLAVALAAVEGFVLYQLLLQNGRLMLRLEEVEARIDAYDEAEAALEGEDEDEDEGLPADQPAPAFALSGVHGETLTLDALRAPGKPVLLVFSDPGCGPCGALLPKIAEWQREHSGVLTIAVISRGSAADNRARSTEHGLSHVLLQRDREVANAYNVAGTPSAVLVRADGMLDGKPSAGSAAIEARVAALVAGRQPSPNGANGPNGTANGANGTANGANGTANGANGTANGNSRPAGPAAAAVGSPAPEVSLPDLNGKTVELARLRGNETMLLFWNPSCGFCARMLDDLKAWEQSAPKGAPRIVLVSTGTADQNRAMGLSSTVLLDSGFTVGPRFGARGTPSAVLVDARGRIASGVAVGSVAALKLIRGETPSASAAG